MDIPDTTTPFDIDNLMAEVARRRPLFHSEADFQHEFAWDAHHRFPDASIRLEKPISTNRGVVYLDVLIQRPHSMVAVELKYKTRQLSLETSTETYSLRNHSAHDVGRYDFIKDISRLEGMAESYDGVVGYAVLLTNESAYWREPSSTTTVDAAFRLHEGRVLSGEMAWGEAAASGTMKSREKPIHLKRLYPLKWRDYSFLSDSSGSVFRYLAVAVESDG